jgi:hypothetical protein
MLVTVTLELAALEFTMPVGGAMLAVFESVPVALVATVAVTVNVT